MPFPIPARTDLQAQILADMQARIPGADTIVRRSTVLVLAYVWAGSLWLVYRFIGWLAKQLFITSAETAYLEMRLSNYGIAREGATFAAGNAIFTGTASVPIPSGSVIQTSDAAFQFATQGSASIGGGGTVTVPILALTAGAGGNLPAAAPLTLTIAIAGVQPVATADGAGLSGGTDAEADPALRARGLARIQKPPQGGAGTDYVAWAKLVPGVTRVWVYPLNRGAGTVDVLFVMDARANNIPLAGDITAVQASIDANRPVTSNALVLAPTADTLAITIHALAPATTVMQNAIIASLAALARTVAAGSATIGDGVSSGAPGGALLLEQIYAAISAAGPTAFDLTAPVADVAFAAGHLPGTLTIAFT